MTHEERHCPGCCCYRQLKPYEITPELRREIDSMTREEFMRRTERALNDALKTIAASFEEKP